MWIFIGIAVLYLLLGFTNRRRRPIRGLLYLILAFWILVGRLLLAYYHLVFFVIGALILVAILLVSLREQRGR